MNATEAALPRLPIAETTYRILHEGLSPREAAAELMERPVGSEW